MILPCPLCYFPLKSLTDSLLHRIFGFNVVSSCEVLNSKRFFHTPSEVLLWVASINTGGTLQLAKKQRSQHVPLGTQPVNWSFSIFNIAYCIFDRPVAMYIWCGLIGHVCISGHLFLQLMKSLNNQASHANGMTFTFTIYLSEQSVQYKLLWRLWFENWLHGRYPNFK